MISVLVDENLSEYLANGLDQLNRPLDNGIKVVSMATRFRKGIKDEEWIPAWSKEDGIFLSQDLNMTRTKHLAELLHSQKMAAIFLKPPKGTPYWNRVRMVIDQWEEICNIILNKKRPYSYVVKQRSIARL